MNKDVEKILLNEEQIAEICKKLGKTAVQHLLLGDLTVLHISIKADSLLLILDHCIRNNKDNGDNADYSAND